ncbi:glycosyltransferase [uncultured Desulfosarcina sp.]|uniref:glycosyltransferase n=1 Tax=uncultured Desulfosarcina sp. TaxID=218289 RepID=UPI0029C76EE1|nr:glycosyltransferase [uncultured Desulfosarcina sp.]
MKVLLILDHAPDYRESFLRELSNHVSLTVGAQPCEQDGLAAPDRSNDYTYVDLPSRRFMGIFWQPHLEAILLSEKWDVICCDFNLRHFARLFYFLKYRRLHQRWIWRGLIFGSNKNAAINAVRKFFLKGSAACLVYSDEVAEKIKEDFGLSAVSFNNTEVKQDEFRKGFFDNHNELRLLFVGTFKPRKQIGRLVALAQRRSDVHVRVVGPGMEQLDLPVELKAMDRITILDRTTGQALNRHFDWADLVVSPGNVGLLVMNAARHGKGIVVDNNSYHGPEHWLAKKAGQPFISFGSANDVDEFIQKVMNNRELLQQWAEQLQNLAKEKYTVEYMVQAHYQTFKAVAATTHA